MIGDPAWLRRGFQPGKTGFDHRETLLQGRDPSVGRLLTFACTGGHLHHRVVLVPAHEIERADRLVDSGSYDRLPLLAQAGQRGDGATGHTGDVVEESWTIGHCFGSLRLRRRLPPTTFDFYNPPP